MAVVVSCAVERAWCCVGFVMGRECEAMEVASRFDVVMIRIARETSGAHVTAASST
jgi:hypothetical protein